MENFQIFNNQSYLRQCAEDMFTDGLIAAMDESASAKIAQEICIISFKFAPTSTDPKLLSLPLLSKLDLSAIDIELQFKEILTQFLRYERSGCSFYSKVFLEYIINSYKDYHKFVLPSDLTEKNRIETLWRSIQGLNKCHVKFFELLSQKFIPDDITLLEFLVLPTTQKSKLVLKNCIDHLSNDYIGHYVVARTSVAIESLKFFCCSDVKEILLDLNTMNIDIIEIERNFHESSSIEAIIVSCLMDICSLQDFTQFKAVCVLFKFVLERLSINESPCFLSSSSCFTGLLSCCLAFDDLDKDSIDIMVDLISFTLTLGGPELILTDLIRDLEAAKVMLNYFPIPPLSVLLQPKLLHEIHSFCGHNWRKDLNSLKLRKLHHTRAIQLDVEKFFVVMRPLLEENLLYRERSGLLPIELYLIIRMAFSYWIRNCEILNECEQIMNIMQFVEDIFKVSSIICSRKLFSSDFIAMIISSALIKRSTSQAYLKSLGNILERLHLSQIDGVSSFEDNLSQSLLNAKVTHVLMSKSILEHVRQIRYRASKLDHSITSSDFAELVNSDYLIRQAVKFNSRQILDIELVAELQKIKLLVSIFRLCQKFDVQSIEVQSILVTVIDKSYNPGIDPVWGIDKDLFSAIVFVLFDKDDERNELKSTKNGEFPDLTFLLSNTSYGSLSQIDILNRILLGSLVVSLHFELKYCSKYLLKYLFLRFPSVLWLESLKSAFNHILAIGFSTIQDCDDCELLMSEIMCSSPDFIFIPNYGILSIGKDKSSRNLGNSSDLIDQLPYELSNEAAYLTCSSSTSFITRLILSSIIKETKENLLGLQQRCKDFQHDIRNLSPRISTGDGDSTVAIDRNLHHRSFIENKLIQQGFSIAGARRASFNTKDDGTLEAALAWAIDHSQDCDFDYPLVAIDDTCLRSSPLTEQSDMFMECVEFLADSLSFEKLFSLPLSAVSSSIRDEIYDSSLSSNGFEETINQQLEIKKLNSTKPQNISPKFIDDFVDWDDCAETNEAVQSTASYSIDDSQCLDTCKLLDAATAELHCIKSNESNVLGSFSSQPVELSNSRESENSSEDLKSLISSEVVGPNNIYSGSYLPNANTELLSNEEAYDIGRDTMILSINSPHLQHEGTRDDVFIELNPDLSQLESNIRTFYNSLTTFQRSRFPALNSSDSDETIKQKIVAGLKNYIKAAPLEKVLSLLRLFEHPCLEHENRISIGHNIAESNKILDELYTVTFVSNPDKCLLRDPLTWICFALLLRRLLESKSESNITEDLLNALVKVPTSSIVVLELYYKECDESNIGGIRFLKQILVHVLEHLVSMLEETNKENWNEEIALFRLMTSQPCNHETTTFLSNFECLYEKDEWISKALRCLTEDISMIRKIEKILNSFDVDVKLLLQSSESLFSSRINGDLSQKKTLLAIKNKLSFTNLGSWQAAIGKILLGSESMSLLILCAALSCFDNNDLEPLLTNFPTLMEMQFSYMGLFICILAGFTGDALDWVTKITSSSTLYSLLPFDFPNMRIMTLSNRESFLSKFLEKYKSNAISNPIIIILIEIALCLISLPMSSIEVVMESFSNTCCLQRKILDSELRGHNNDILMLRKILSLLSSPCFTDTLETAEKETFSEFLYLKQEIPGIVCKILSLDCTEITSDFSHVVEVCKARFTAQEGIELLDCAAHAMLTFLTIKDSWSEIFSKVFIDLCSQIKSSQYHHFGLVSFLARRLCVIGDTYTASWKFLSKFEACADVSDAWQLISVLINDITLLPECHDYSYTSSLDALIDRLALCTANILAGSNAPSSSFLWSSVVGILRQWRLTYSSVPNYLVSLPNDAVFSGWSTIQSALLAEENWHLLCESFLLEGVHCDFSLLRKSSAALSSPFKTLALAIGLLSNEKLCIPNENPVQFINEVIVQAQILPLESFHKFSQIIAFGILHFKLPYSLALENHLGLRALLRAGMDKDKLTSSDDFDIDTSDDHKDKNDWDSWSDDDSFEHLKAMPDDLIQDDEAELGSLVSNMCLSHSFIIECNQKFKQSKLTSVWARFLSKLFQQGKICCAYALLWRLENKPKLLFSLESGAALLLARLEQNEAECSKIKEEPSPEQLETIAILANLLQ